MHSFDVPMQPQCVMCCAGWKYGWIFRHENQPHPPSLFHFGQLPQCAKSDLIHCLEKKKLPPTTNDNTPNVTAVLLNGAIIVKMLKHGTAKTFYDYRQLFIKDITCKLQHATRVDIVWDLYLPSYSLKTTARYKKRERHQTTCWSKESPSRRLGCRL